MGDGIGHDHAGRPADGLTERNGLLVAPAGDDLDLELGRVEARRRRLFVVGAIAAVGAAAIATALIVLEAVDLPDWTGWALLATTVVFLLDAVQQERAMAGIIRAAGAQQERGEELASRLADLSGLLDVAGRISATLLPEEIYDVVVDAAIELLDADSVTLWLRVGDVLAVAASTGTGAPTLGTTAPVAEVGAARALAEGVPVRDDPERWMAVPVIVGTRRVGVLELGRDHAGDPFGDRAALLAQLFAAEAAGAFLNANRYDLQRARTEELVAARELHTDAIADTVHDLRAPLAGLVGYAELLRDRFEDLGTARRTEAVGAVCEQADKLVDLIDAVFEAASIEARVTRRREPVVVADALTAAVATVTAGRAEARITTEVPEVSPVVLGDPDALERVVTNLLANAVEHGSPDVRVRVSVRRREVRVHVLDHGPGIPDDEVERLFRHRDAAGDPRGRGLAIVDALVRAMDGRVAVRSELGVGTVFTVQLPLAAS